jgi:hypothetical protein
MTNNPLLGQISADIFQIQHRLNTIKERKVEQSAEADRLRGGLAPPFYVPKNVILNQIIT